MRWTLRIILLAAAVGFGTGCGDITVVDNGAVSDAADAGQPPAAPCNASTKCDHGEVCNLVNGACVDCLLDGDCNRGKNSRCDTIRSVCVECFSDDDCDDDKRCNTAGECK